MEILIQILIEVFGEILIQVFAALFTHFVRYVNVNTKAKKILKYTISILVFGSTLILLCFAISHKRNLYTNSILIYFFVLVLLYIARFITQNKDDKTLANKVIWLTRIVHFVFPIIMIITATLNYDETSKYIIITSSVALVIYLFINVYRIWSHMNKRGGQKILV